MALIKVNDKCILNDDHEFVTKLIGEAEPVRIVCTMQPQQQVAYPQAGFERRPEGKWA